MQNPSQGRRSLEFLIKAEGLKLFGFQDMDNADRLQL
jgi:hypothetical protein